MAIAKKKDTSPINLTLIERGQIDACILGTTSIVLNRISEKARRQLLAPQTKGRAERAATMKHDPLEEYRTSPYLDMTPDGPTALQVVTSSIKLAMATVPQDLPDTNTSMAQLKRLIWAVGERTALYGVPKLMMSITRNSDMGHTPDVRTRAVVEQWACRVSITYVKPVLRDEVVAKLLAAAGFMRGIGDWRAEKGNGTHGLFEVVAESDPRFKHVVKHGGRAAQLAALEEPTFYDRESEELYAWFVDEKARRGHGEAPSKTNGKRKKVVAEEVTL